MILKSILGVGLVLAFYWTYKTKSRFPFIITIGMAAGLALALIPNNTWFKPGLYVYLGFVAISFIYGFLAFDRTVGARLFICSISALIFSYWIWVLNHWHGNTLVAPALILVITAISLITQVKVKNGRGFLVLMIADAIAILIEQWLGVA